MAGHRFNPEHAHKLMDPKRKELLPPNRIIEQFGIEFGDEVADLGAGSGYFTLPIAEKTGNTVYAVDVEPKMLEILKQNAVNKSITNIEYIVSDLEDIKLEDKSVDKAVVGFVIHEVPDMTKALSEIKRILKPGGRTLILEWEAKEMEMGPPLHERIPSEKLRDFIEKQAFQVQLSYPNEYHYILNIRPI